MMKNTKTTPARLLPLAMLVVLGCKAPSAKQPIPETIDAPPPSASCSQVPLPDTMPGDLATVLVAEHDVSDDPVTPGALVCPVDTVMSARTVGIGASDVADVVQVYCLRKDKRHGPFHAYRGVLRVTEGRYRDGLRVGLWTLRDLEGSGFRRGYFVDGLRHGDWLSWHSDQILAWRGNFRCSKRQGVFSWWQPSGEKLQEGSFVDDRRDGEWTYWWPNGQRKEQGLFVSGKRQGSWTQWDEAGKPESRSYDNGERQP